MDLHAPNEILVRPAEVPANLRIHRPINAMMMVMTMVAMLTMPTTDGDAMIDGDGDDAGGDADDADGQCDYPRC